jgi:succinyl-CoA synthetase beta subunit
VPLVIRLTGTNEDKARQILKDFGLGATTSMDEAVRMVIEKAQEVGA